MQTNKLHHRINLYSEKKNRHYKCLSPIAYETLINTLLKGTVVTYYSKIFPYFWQLKGKKKTSSLTTFRKC